jgi:predicted outer membrane repeat protein
MSRNRSSLKSFSSSRHVLAYAPLAVAIMLSFARPTQAANIAVNSADAVSETGVCTIIDAVTAVNTQAAVNGCAAGDGNSDTIDLTGFTTPTTISLTQATPLSGHALVISKNVTITGGLSGQTPLVTLERSTVSGTDSFGLIDTSAPLTINGLILSNGAAGTYSGGAILAGDALTLNYCVVQNNKTDATGGGIAASAGQVSVMHSTITGNTAGNAGGGIESLVSMQIYYSTVSNNTTLSATTSTNGGGGVFSNSSLRVRNSTFDGNTSASTGGAIYMADIADIVDSTISNNTASNGSGGGIFASTVGISLSRSTVAANHASGNGGGINGGPVDLTNSTITGNTSTGIGAGVAASVFTSSYVTVALNTSGGPGGGVNFTTSAESYGTIFSGNKNGAAADDLASAGTAALTGEYNIVGTTTVTIADTTHNFSCDPALLPLADNGGPTQTMALQTGDTCAIDHASTSPAQSTDQRGFLRPVTVGTNADIGAYEFGSDPDIIFADGFES